MGLDSFMTRDRGTGRPSSVFCYDEYLRLYLLSRLCSDGIIIMRLDPREVTVEAKSHWIKRTGEYR